MRIFSATEIWRRFALGTVSDKASDLPFVLVIMNCSPLPRFELTGLTPVVSDHVDRWGFADPTYRIMRDDMMHRRFLHVHIAASKTDQQRRGRDMAVNELPLDEPLWAVRAIDAWLAETAGKIEDDGPLFLAFNRSARGFKSNAIGGADVAQVVKRLAALAGFTLETLAAHAMRRGFATSAINKGVLRAVVMKHGGWNQPRCSTARCGFPRG